MEKKLESGGIGLKIPCHKVILVMKLTCFLICCLLFNVQAAVKAQGQTVSLKLEQVSVAEAIRQLKEQTQLDFFFSNKQVDVDRKVSLDLQDIRLDEALKMLLGEGYSYEFLDDVVVIKPVEVKNPKMGVPQEKVTVKGVVRDEKGELLPGVTVTIKGTSLGTATDVDGKWALDLPDMDNIVLVFSFVGMKTQEVAYKGQEEMNVVMLNEVSEIDEVVVTGYFERRVDSYTGNAKVVKGDELRAINPTNIVQALAFLDPDIVIQENNELGSDPNAMPSIHIQGTSSITTAQDQFIDDPNLPTFILDGFEVSYQTFHDMDPNRIASIVILKDAAATAVYGSRAANGVIVITTVAPKPGEIDLSYQVNLNFSSPDLSSYDLLNAREKMELEKEFDIRSEDVNVYQYNRVRKWIAGGTETDWLSQPTRNALTHTHTLNLMGGEKGLRYNLNFNYSSNPGVMKGSNRKTFNVTADIIYRPSEKLNFKNSVTYSHNNSENSPYGSFETYTLMNPYFPIYDENGEMIKKYVTDESDGGAMDFSGLNTNPLWDAKNGNFSKSKYSAFIENFAIDWKFYKDFRLQVSLAYSEQNDQSDDFVSPEDSEFANTQDRSDMGRYTIRNAKNTSFNGKATLGYLKYINKHNINANLGYELTMTTNEAYSHVATGFGSSYLNYLAFATKYEENSVPTVQESSVHTLGAFLSLNYTYDNRLLLDASFRFDGSSQFGSEKKIAPFYSLGLGWNLHNESFLRKVSWIDQLKIRATYGQTGSVKFAAYQAKDTYSYFKTERYLDNLSIYMLALGNENLKWQKTNQYDVGINAAFFNNVFSFSINYYYKQTLDLLYDVVLPTSSGFKSYVENLGEMRNKGLSFSTRISFLNKPQIRGSFFANGNYNKSENHSQYKDGDPVTAIYAVSSLGIDPATGQELYLDLNGNPTWEYNADDERICGDTAPKLQGSFGLNGRYKNLSISLGFSYSFGSQEFNQTLLDKVENASLVNNVDRRVLTETWHKEGDVKSFGHPLGDAISRSARFVQDNNWLKFSSLNLTYDLNADSFIKRIKMSSMQLTFTTNDLFYLSTIKRERGTSYPFARSFTFGLRMNF